MALSRREERFLNAMKNCVMNGEYTEYYAITLLEDDQKYGWMTDEARDSFYDWLDEYHAEQWRKGVDERGQHAETHVVDVVYNTPDDPDEPGEQGEPGETGEPGEQDEP